MTPKTVGTLTRGHPSLEHGVDANIPDRPGVMLINHARQRGYREIAARLEAVGARE